MASQGSGMHRGDGQKQVETSSITGWATEWVDFASEPTTLLPYLRPHLRSRLLHLHFCPLACPFRHGSSTCFPAEPLVTHHFQLGHVPQGEIGDVHLQAVGESGSWQTAQGHHRQPVLNLSFSSDSKIGSQIGTWL